MRRYFLLDVYNFIGETIKEKLISHHRIPFVVSMNINSVLDFLCL